jgi:hypothetical protein
MLPWVCLALLAAPARAAENVLKLVPDSALGFVLVNRAADLDGKLQDLCRQMQIPPPSLLARIKVAGGIGEGLDEKGTVALLLLPAEEGPIPVPIILVPVTDYGKFIAQFNPGEAEAGLTKIEFANGEKAWARSIGGYAALTGPPWRKTLETGLRLAHEVPAGLAPLEAWLAENDAAAVITRPGIKVLSAQVQEAIGRMKAAMAKLSENAATQPLADQMKQAEVGLSMYVMLFQAMEREVALSALGARLDKQSVLHVTTRTRMIAGGKWAQLTAPAQPAGENLLAGLPAGPYVMAGGGVVPAGTWEAMMRLSFDMMKSMHDLYGLSEEQISKLQQATSSSVSMLKSIRSAALVWGVGQSEAPLLAKMVGVMRVDDAGPFMADYEKRFKQYNEALKQGNSPLLQPGEVEKSEIGGAPALKITMKLPHPPGSQAAQAARMMEGMVGPGGKIVAWLAAPDKHTVVFGYSKQAVQEALEAKGRPGLAGDADLAKTAALLPPGAACVGYLSPAGTIEFVKRMIPLVMPAGPGLPTIPEFPKTPPIGLAITTVPGELQTHLVVPVEVFKAAGVYVGEAAAKARGGSSPER